MSNLFFALLVYAVPVLLLAIPFILIAQILFSRSKSPTPPSVNQESARPDLNQLEEKLKKLVVDNQLNQKTDSLEQDLRATPTHIIADYLKQNKQTLKGFHLFRLIFSLIKNNTDDKNIIRLLHHYLPTTSTAHLYTLLKACKEFLNLNPEDCERKKSLLKDLSQNNLHSTLIYLQEKLNQTLNLLPTLPIALQQPLIDKAATYGLIFASFAEFYNPEATEKILHLTSLISPELFNYWHTPPQHLAPFSQNYIPKSSLYLH